VKVGASGDLEAPRCAHPAHVLVEDVAAADHADAR
jgi:hypothetical protein